MQDGCLQRRSGAFFAALRNEVLMLDIHAPIAYLYQSNTFH
jgi:hypothetical protein